MRNYDLCIPNFACVFFVDSSLTRPMRAGAHSQTLADAHSSYSAIIYASYLASCVKITSRICRFYASTIVDGIVEGYDRSKSLKRKRLLMKLLAEIKIWKEILDEIYPRN